MYMYFCLKYSEVKLITGEDQEVDMCNLCRMFTKTWEEIKKEKPVVLEAKVEKKKFYRINKQKGGKAKFYINGKELERVEEFRYFRSIPQQDDDHTPIIIRQIKIQIELEWFCKNTKTWRSKYNYHGKLLYGSDTICIALWDRLVDKWY